MQTFMENKYATSELASPLRRLAARWLDRLVAVLGAFTIGGVLWGFSVATAILLALCWVFGYLFLKDALTLFDGKSIGKKAMGIRVVDRNTRQPITGNYGKSIMRELPQWVPLLNIIDAFIIFDNKHRIGDRMADTSVIYDQD